MAKGLQKKIEKRKETLFFLIKLLLLSIPLYIVMWFCDLSFLQGIVTRTIFYFLKLAGASVKMEGFALLFKDFFFMISKDCTGWKGMMFLGALILSTKASWRKRLAGLSVGVPAFFSFNLLRILIMVWIGLKDKTMFFILHDILWQFSMVAVVILLWMMWIKMGSDNEKK